MSPRKAATGPAGDKAEDALQTLPLLLEIGTEEIPARFLPVALSDLRSLASSLFAEYRLGFEEINTFATPRRIVLMMKGVRPAQEDSRKEIFGPSKKVAFDDQGHPTKAAVGFATSLGIRPDDLVIKQKGKSDYVAAVIEEKGLDAKSVLPDVMKKIILSLRFPKAMRWGSGSLTFARPIHWIVSIFGSETVHFEIDGIKSGNQTRGHRFLSPASFQIKELSSYMSFLGNNFVILDPEKREKTIRKGISELAVSAGGQPVVDEDLLRTVTFLVELPVPVLCSFSAEYLALPKELLVTVMKDHQKYFAVQDSKGDLLNSFIVISNTRDENRDTVRIGAERVIKARFDDAKFYYHEDRKKALEERVEDLRNVTFHDRLGSLYNKTQRVVAMASFLAEKLDPSIKDSVVRAALLSKTDLLTGAVREFPELQGVMGKYYALQSGEDEKTAVALEEQYLPQSFGARLPETHMGSLLSLSDKIDNVASFFAIGMVPTGSEDPFALRRQAMGITAVLIDRAYILTLRELFEKALQNLSNIRIEKNALENILSFMEQRIEFVLSSYGYAQDLVRSVISLSSSHPLVTIAGRIEALKAFREKTVFQDFLLAIKRAHNIVPKTPLPGVRSELLLADEEKTLYLTLTKLRESVVSSVEKTEFKEGLALFSEITLPVNNFFDKVLVMDKQEEVRANRLSLLKEVWLTASLFGDFSKLH